MKRSPLRYAVWICMASVAFMLIYMVAAVYFGEDIGYDVIGIFVLAGLFATLLSRIAAQEESER